MLKRRKLKNSTIIFIGIIIILIGVVIIASNYLVSKKYKVFSDMSILLYESETPKNISSINIETTSGLLSPLNYIDKYVVKQKPDAPASPKYSYIGILEIPKLNVKNGFVSPDSKYNNVDYNITVINGSQMPDVSNSNLILAAHSGFCSVCYFNDLYKLNKGDEAYIHYNEVTYKYKIVKIYTVNKTGTVSLYKNPDKQTLTLITCTRNSDTKQTVYILELE